MMPPHTPISSLLSPFLRLSLRPSLTTTTISPIAKPLTILPQQCTSSPRAFTTTPSLFKKDKKGGKGKRPAKTIAEQRIALIRYHLQHPLTPRPLRFSRIRALRHWTIHRAWMLARRKKLEREEKELSRMHQSMHDACEELRLLDADKPQTKDSGRLYRIAMEKKGVFGHGGVPIEYARFQVDTPGKEAWNHGWTR